LRQPTGSAQSAIDITAGPAPSGQGSGITYSSVSFDARRGTHKNFQLTVTDEGSVFSAGCIRPRNPYASPCEPVVSVPANQQPPPPAALVADGLGDAEMTSDVFPYPSKPNGKGNPLTDAINQHFQRKNQNQNQSPSPNQNPNSSSPNTSSRSGSNEQLELLDHPSHPQLQQEANGGKAKPSCHCTNISIMHLFHEMKQEFPTIPDAIVTQCVNENCHQRDNCIQMLRKELALHPIPVQSYPAKVLQQQQQQQHQNRQAKPPTPLKPSRVAPPHPEVVQSNGVATPPAGGSPHLNPQPRPRPTTLNLQRQFSTQLQQKIQQRQQRQQRDNQPPQLTPTSLSKPLRRAPPLPPPPKPKPGSFSNDSSCLTSPMSSSESELSLNAVSLSSPTSAAAPTMKTFPSIQINLIA